MKRDTYWDSLKFVLIALVVYGHIVVNYDDVRINKLMLNFVYLFHMPLFVFVSGRFSRIRDVRKYRKGIVRLVETYVVFQLLLSVFAWMQGGRWSWVSLLVEPNWLLWYLLALIWWRLAVMVLYYCKIPSSSPYLLVVSICIGLMSGFIPVSGTLALQRTLGFLPYFALGYVTASVDVRQYVKRIPILVAISVIVAVLIAFWKIDINFKPFLSHLLPYTVSGVSVTDALLVRCIILLLAMVIGAMVMRVVPARQILAKWGMKTMHIYIYHAFIVSLLVIAIRKDWLPNNELLLFAYTLGVIFMILLFARFRVSDYLLNPFTQWNDKIELGKK
ncbi:MAG: acyltransferase family protein [Prevotella sp.]|nr:acyltransferase family protein [Prevotella sp.]